MTTQLSLYEAQTIGAPHNGTETSALAASQVNVSRQQRLILEALADGGLNQDEISDRTGLLRSAVAGRVNTLVREGLVRHSGNSRLTKYGRLAAVWELAR